MLIFQLSSSWWPASKPKDKKESPVVWSIDTVKNKVGPLCTGEVAKEILNSGDIESKIMEVKEAIGQLHKHEKGTMGLVNHLEKAAYAKLFVMDPAAYIGMHKAIGWGSVDYGLFETAPLQIANIAIAAAPGAGRAIRVISRDEKLIKVFGDMPEKFVELARAAGSNTREVFETLKDEEILGMFVAYPTQFCKIVKAGGVDAIEELKALKDFTVKTERRGGVRFIDHPNEYAEIAEAAGKGIVDVLKAMVYDSIVMGTHNPIGLIFSNYPTKCVEFAKVAKDKTGGVFLSLEDEDMRDMFLLFCKGKIEISQFMTYYNAHK